jgi:hypothetical protein
MSNAAEKLAAHILWTGAEAERIKCAIGGRVGEAQGDRGETITGADSLKARIAEIGAETARIQTSSGEYLWVCRREKPPLLPDSEPPKGEQNPLRRQDGKPIARRQVS